MRRIREVSAGSSPRLYRHPEWNEAHPWLEQATTGSASDFDLRLFGPEPAGAVMERWDSLRDTLGFGRAVHARQVHGSRVATHSRRGHDNPEPGLDVLADRDGHVTRSADLLLTVAVADCVPVFLVDPGSRAVGVVHAGWRGVVAGVLDSGIQALVALGADLGDLEMHMGPHICDRCYEVGPEVHEALDLKAPKAPTPVSLSLALSGRAESAGIAANRITASTLCTRCDSDHFYSHRGGGEGRQVGLIGIRPS